MFLKELVSQDDRMMAPLQRTYGMTSINAHCDIMIWLLSLLLLSCLCNICSLTLLWLHIVSLSLRLLLFLFSGELRNLVGSILGGQTGSGISLEQVRVGEVRV